MAKAQAQILDILNDFPELMKEYYWTVYERGYDEGVDADGCYGRGPYGEPKEYRDGDPDEIENEMREALDIIRQYISKH